METGDNPLRAQREAIVREHMDSENRLDFETSLGAFETPRYELIATGQTYEGKDAVRGYYASSRAIFPDQRNEIRAIYHADGAVIVEFDLLGTQGAPLPGVPNVGGKFRCQMIALFLFEGDKVVCERVYFDSATIARQLGAQGIPAATS